MIRLDSTVPVVSCSKAALQADGEGVGREWNSADATPPPSGSMASVAVAVHS